jgi:hypothetical protein
MAKNKNCSRDAITTPPMRISYPQIFTPRAFEDGGTPRFSVILMVDKTDKEHMAFVKQLYQDLDAVRKEHWPDEAKRPRNALMGETKSPIKDGDKTVDTNGIPLSEKNPEYAGHYIITASATRKPAVVNRNLHEVIDPNVVYGGCRCKVNVNAYSFDVRANRGATVGLNGVQFWDGGEPFGGGRPPVEDMFDAAPNGSDNPDNYDGGDPFAPASPQRAARTSQHDASPFPTDNNDDDIPF